MKKYIWLCFLMVFMLVVVSPGSLFCQEEEEGEEEPVQAYPNPMAWKQLESMSTLRAIKMAQKGQVWEFDLRNIKEGLEKAKVNEKVTIFYVNPEGIAYPLGTYSPVKQKIQRRRIQKQKSKMLKDSVNPKLINPQPEPPRTAVPVKFHTIPAIKQIPHSMATKMPDIRWKNKSVLVFKDAAGQTKAVIHLSMGPIPKTPVKRKQLR